MLVRFGSCIVNLTANWVTRAGYEQDLEPKEVDVLRLLLDRPGTLISYEEFAAAIWPDVHVDIKRAVNTRVSRLRGALGDPSYIQNEPGTGYRFNPDVPLQRETYANIPSQNSRPR